MEKQTETLMGTHRSRSPQLSSHMAKTSDCMGLLTHLAASVRHVNCTENISHSRAVPTSTLAPTPRPRCKDHFHIQYLASPMTT